ncbi:hypothetical protein FPV67DRAFT_428539 [Lyophyllum atratum]|nr:hypothetical protein FPV67DRAFT_428539 [Lyophyllum atratum]
MPNPVTSPSSTRIVNKASTLKPRGQVKKTRIVRRRGRATGDLGSDDEIEREMATDSESEDELSSLDSASDSDTEPASEDVIPNGRSRTFTPSTSQSPGERDVNEKEAAGPEAFFAPGGNWSEMVAEETANGPADLPVIEFANFDGQDSVPPTARPKKTKKLAKSARPAPEAPALSSQPNGDQSSDETREIPHVASTSRSPDHTFPRAPGQTARQAYQQRLESDPSYVPTVGGFWGHDDRLLDKDLRSLSGWWRGRWQGRGRARGFMRGRGRGGFFGGHANDDNGQHNGGDMIDVPPIERAWTHDGFEEMKQREEQRRAAQRTQPPPPTFQGPGGFRGGRGQVPVRGGRGGFGRGGFVNPSGRSSVNSGRIWFQTKPELTWTKQHEGFLYFELEPSLKPRQGQGQGILVKLPGKQGKVARAPPRAFPPLTPSTSKPTTTSVAGSEQEERVYTVNLPKRSGKEKEVEVAPSPETSIEEIFTVRPSLAPANPPPFKQAPPTVEVVTAAPPIPRHWPREAPPHRPDGPIATSSQSQPEASVRLQLEQLSLEPKESDPARQAKTEKAVMKKPSNEVQEQERPAAVAVPEVEERPSIPSLPTLFTPPVSQPSPVYGSPYGYPPALPPGIAMNQHGMPYELATGRPVYLQAPPPPPPPMYNPRPVMHSHLPPSALTFVPGHMSHHSAVSPDFLAHSASPHTPPMNGFIDPSTGTPIFSFPRQTSRIEIRAPSENVEVKSPTKTHVPRPSSLRTTASAFEPTRPSSDASMNGYFPTLSTPENGSLPTYVPVEGAEGYVDGSAAPQHDQGMMGYAQYHPQQYYYPDAYGGYAPNPYMDLSHARPYEMYPPPPEGTIYY